MEHDFEEQRRTTEAVLEDLADRHDLPARATLDLQFLPVAGADWAGVVAALADVGYTGQAVADEEGDWFEVAVADVPLTLEGIWKHERATTEVALSCGFRPDGWGFFVG